LRLAAGELDAAALLGLESGEAASDAAGTEAVREQAAWMLVARAVMNLDEAIVKR